MPRRGENIRKRKDGRWEGRYIKKRDFAGKATYGSVYAKTYLEVKRKLTQMNVKIESSTFHQKKQNITFREVLYLWLENNRIKLRDQTYANYSYMIERHIIPFIGSILVSKVDVKYINAFLLKKNTHGRLDGKGGLSPSYIKKISFIITAAIDFAVRENYCDPIKGEIVKPIKKKNELRVLSMKEQAQLEHYIMTEFDDRKLGVLLSLYAGLRIGEVCALKWNDIDFEMKTIHIHHTVKRITNIDANVGENKTKLILGDTKTISSNRVVPIPPNLFSILKEHRKNGDAFLMKGSTYEYIDPRTYQYNFHNYLIDCQIRIVNYHVLRHTFATRCIESGMDIKSLSEILGHASVNTTLNTYIHSSLEHKRNQIKAMVIYCGQ